MERRLAAILAADMVGFSRQMQTDDVGTLAKLREIRSSVVEPEMAAHRGRIFKTTGDGFLAEFQSAVDAILCAVAIQDAVNRRNVPVADAERLLFRMGLNIGDIIVEDGDVFGDGVNVAARLEPLAPAGGIVVSATKRDQLLNKTPVGFDPMGPQKLKNIAGTVEAFRVLPDGTASPAARSPATAHDNDDAVPTLAILPFENMSADAEQEHLGDGIAEDLISSLSQIGHLSVVPRASAFTFKNRGARSEEIGCELGARYILTGSLRKSGERIRLSVELTDARDDSLVWSARFDRRLDDIFAVQDEITLTIATALQVQLTEGEQAMLRHTTTNNVEAWTRFIQGLSFFRTVSAETYRRARRCFEDALALDPDSAQIRAMLACTLAIEGRFHWTVNRDETLARAKEQADAALAIAPDNPDAWAALGYWHMSHRRLDESAEAYARAASLAPDHADLRALSALALTFAERPEEAIRETLTAMRLNPFGPGWYRGILGHAYRYAGRYDDAITVLSEYNRQSPGFGLVDIVLTYTDMGETEKARETAKALIAARPEFTVEKWALTQNCADPERLARDRRSLTATGLL